MNLETRKQLNQKYKNEKGIEMKMRDSIIGQVYETTNYNKFKLSKGNRSISLKSKQKNNFNEYGVIAPIIVNRDFVIIDGQHRWSWAKENNKPISYIIVDGLSDEHIVAMNTTQKSWTFTNYVESYAEKGNKEYIDLLYLLRTYTYPVQEIAAISMGRKSHSPMQKLVQEGNFKFDNYSECASYLKNFTRMIDETNIVCKGALLTSFQRLYSLNTFSLDRFIAKAIETNGKDMLEKLSRNPTNITMGLLEIYNHKLNVNSVNYIDYYIDSKGLIQLVTK